MVEPTRRQLLTTGLRLGVAGGAALLGSPLARIASAKGTQARGVPGSDKAILVVLELSGGNDGLNTLVPYGDDTYYRQRPTIGIAAEKLRKVDEHYGFSPGMAGLERLYKDGKLAVVHGCGYEQPSFSHFSSSSRHCSSLLRFLYQKKYMPTAERSPPETKKANFSQACQTKDMAPRRRKSCMGTDRHSATAAPIPIARRRIFSLPSG